jgi:hypothetical protein
MSFYEMSPPKLNFYILSPHSQLSSSALGNHLAHHQLPLNCLQPIIILPQFSTGHLLAHLLPAVTQPWSPVSHHSIVPTTITRSSPPTSTLAPLKPPKKKVVNYFSFQVQASTLSFWGMLEYLGYNLC